jgi:hypothetical protein
MFRLWQDIQFEKQSGMNWCSRSGVKIRVPDTGLGKTLDCMADWLRVNVLAADFACHSAPGLACSTAAFYFRNVETAQ